MNYRPEQRYLFTGASGQVRHSSSQQQTYECHSPELTSYRAAARFRVFDLLVQTNLSHALQVLQNLTEFAFVILPCLAPPSSGLPTVSD